MATAAQITANQANDAHDFPTGLGHLIEEEGFGVAVRGVLGVEGGAEVFESGGVFVGEDGEDGTASP